MEIMEISNQSRLRSSFIWLLYKNLLRIHLMVVLTQKSIKITLAPPIDVSVRGGFMQKYYL